MMSSLACRAAFNSGPEIERAPRLDEAFPQCQCEPWSLTATGGAGIADAEIVARIITSPNEYDEDTSTLLTARLTALYSMGLSLIRQGASDAEILASIAELMAGGSEQRNLVGAVLLRASDLRNYSSEDQKRWFGVYATDDRNKMHHVDVLGTEPPGGTSAVSKAKKRRRHKLATDMLPLIVFDADPGLLLKRLRQAGI